MLLEEGAVEALDEAVGLGPPDLRCPAGRKYSRPLSLRMVRIFTPCSSKKGSTWLFRIWTAVTGILLV